MSRYSRRILKRILSTDGGDALLSRDVVRTTLEFSPLSPLVEVKWEALGDLFDYEVRVSTVITTADSKEYAVQWQVLYREDDTDVKLTRFTEVSEDTRHVMDEDDSESALSFVYRHGYRGLLSLPDRRETMWVTTDRIRLTIILGSPRYGTDEDADLLPTVSYLLRNHRATRAMLERWMGFFLLELFTEGTAWSLSEFAVPMPTSRSWAQVVEAYDLLEKAGEKWEDELKSLEDAIVELLSNGSVVSEW